MYKRQTNGRGRSSAAQSFGNEFRRHRDELQREIGRIARELAEMRHAHMTENCEGEAAGKDYVGEQSPTLPARVPVHYSRKGRSKRHISSTPRNKKGCDNLKLLLRRTVVMRSIIFKVVIVNLGLLSTVTRIIAWSRIQLAQKMTTF